MTKATSLRRLLPRLAGVGALAALGAAHAGDPILAPGLWSYHADIHYHASPLSGRMLHKDWKVCVKPGDTTMPAAMPQAPGVQCDKPTLAASGKTLRTSMSCRTTAANGFQSTIEDAFVITPSADKRSVTLDGTVRQTFTGGPVALPATVMTLHTVGKRTGDCAAGQQAHPAG